MKRYCILFLAAALASCNDFLDTAPDNRTELDNADKIGKILVSAYPQYTHMGYVKMMTDDYDMNDMRYSLSVTQELWDAWHWYDDKREQMDSPNYMWSGHYGAISNANQALIAIEQMGRPKNLEPFRGEGLVSRAWNHYMLVNIFSQHYNPEFSGSDLGITYMERAETEVNPAYERSTVKEVYEKIAKDLEDGIKLIDDAVYSVPKYHFNRLAARGFAAEFYLNYRDYKRAIEYADEVLGSNPERMMRNLTKYSSYSYSDYTSIMRKSMEYINPDNNANLFMHTSYSTAGQNAYGSWLTRFTHNAKLMNEETAFAPSPLWSTAGGDASMFVMTYGSRTDAGSIGYYTATIPPLHEYPVGSTSGGWSRAVTVDVSADNVLLVRAEAKIMLNDLEGAMEDINHWVKMRVKAPYNTPKTVAEVVAYYSALPYSTPTASNPKKKLNSNLAAGLSTAQESMIHALLHIRRVEFLNQGHRWFDIKRWGIEVTRRTIDGGTVAEYGDVAPLRYRDKRLAIQLPLGVITAGMTPNPR